MGRKRRRDNIDIDTAEIICGDLPDGAYWAMMEELTGMEPAEIATADAKVTKAKRTRKKK